MKAFRALAVLFSISCLSTVAYADPIDPTDYRFQVLDPPPGYTGTIITGPSLGTVSFSTCPSGPTGVITTPPPDGEDGCFFGLNATGETITAINLFFENTTDNSGGFITALNGQPASCETFADDINSPYMPAFGSSTTCAIDSIPTDPYFGDYELTYNMGAGVPNGYTIILVEFDVDPNAFITPSPNADTVTLTATTPEPNSIVLLSTGVLCIGLMVARRRFSFLNPGR